MENKELSEENDRISMKLFGKLAKDIKYLMCTNFVHQQLLDEGLLRTGLYQWINAFRGEVKRYRDVEDFNKYDIVQINLSVQDYYLIEVIKRQLKPDSKTLIVANNDYTVELWQNSFDFPDRMAKELEQADMIFGTEIHMSNALELITKRQIFTIPHPCFVKRMKTLVPKKKFNSVGVLWHRYDKVTFIPSLAVQDLGMETWLMGYDHSQDPKKFSTSTLYDKVFQGTNFLEFCEQLLSTDIIYEPFTLTSHGRATIDTAALGIPTVGSNRVESVQRCFPFTSIDPWDAKEANKMLKKLVNDENFRTKVISYAREAVEYYNHKNSTTRFLKALETRSLLLKKQED